MRLEQVATLLRSIADRGGGFGSDSERALRALADAIAQRSDMDVEALAKLLTPKARRTVKQKTENSELIEAYIGAFSRCSSPTDAEKVFDRMVADKSVKKDETVSIARLFTGSTRAFKTKQLAQDAIRERIRREAWDQGALEIIKSRALR